MSVDIPIRTLLVDDEEPARLRMRALLQDCSGVQVVGEARDGEEALEAIRRLRCRASRESRWLRRSNRPDPG